MYHCKVRGVLFDAKRIISYSEKLVNIDAQKRLFKGDYPSQSKDTNSIKVFSTEDFKVQIGNIPNGKVDEILEDILEKGIFNMDKLDAVFVDDNFKKIEAYEQGKTFVYISPLDFSSLAMENSTDFRTMSILEEKNVFLHPEQTEDCFDEDFGREEWPQKIVITKSKR